MTEDHLRVPNHCDPLTFAEQLELENQMGLIMQIMDPPPSRPMNRSEWQNVQRMAETLKRYRETNDPHAVEASLPARIRKNGIDYLPY